MAGRPQKVSDEELLQTLKASDDPVLTANEVADPFNIKRQTAYKRLEDLVDRDLADSKKPGRSSKVYWITDAGREYLEN